jgi:hypothetical protein
VTYVILAFILVASLVEIWLFWQIVLDVYQTWQDITEQGSQHLTSERQETVVGEASREGHRLGFTRWQCGLGTTMKSSSAADLRDCVGDLRRRKPRSKF